MKGSFADRTEEELPIGGAEHLAYGHLSGTPHQRTDDDEDIVHHRREEHHQRHHGKDDAGCAHRSVLHAAACNTDQYAAGIRIAALLEVFPRKNALQQLLHLVAYLLHVGIGTQAYIRMVAVVADEVRRAVPGVGADRGHRHQNVETRKRGVLWIVLIDTADGHRFLRGRGEAERMANHLAAHLLAQPTADHALSGCREDLLGIAHQRPCGEDVEETRISKHRLFKVVPTAVLQRQLLFTKLCSIACGRNHLGNLPSQHGCDAARRAAVLLQLFACTLHRLLQFIHVLLVHDAAVVVAFQLHLG